MKKKLISIIIPTKNRLETAAECISLAVNVGTASDVEVLVQDCSDDDSLKLFLEKQSSWEQVNYERTSPVSMTENWNRAVSRASGEYIVFIGDDDAVYPTVIEVANWAKRNNIKAIKQTNYDLKRARFPEREKSQITTHSVYSSCNVFI